MSKLIISGSSSNFLAQNISLKSNLKVSQSRVVHFVNSEMKITLPLDVKDFDQTWVVQSTSSPANDNLMELCLICDTLQREGIKNVNAIIPYFGYARQDKQHLPRECVSMETISKILSTVGVKTVVTADIHNQEALKNVGLSITSVSSMSSIAKQVYADLKLDLQKEKDFTIASPDDGGINRAKLFGEYFYQNQKNLDFVSIKKRRHLDKIHYCEAVELKGEIKDKKVILIDDISTSGGTILNALELCKSNGVQEVYVVIVHPDFAKGVPEKFQNSDLKKVYTTNTIEKTVENLDFYDKFQVMDISDIFVPFL